MSPTQLLQASILSTADTRPGLSKAAWMEKVPGLLRQAGPTLRSSGDDIMKGVKGLFGKKPPVYGGAEGLGMGGVSQAVPKVTGGAGTGSGGFWWGKPSADQLARGNRPGAWLPMTRQWRENMNPLRSRQYANDLGAFHRLGRGVKNVGLYGMAGLGADNVMNTGDRMQRAGELGAATALYQMGQGTTWEKLQRLAAVGFGSPTPVSAAIAKQAPGQTAEMYQYMRGQGQAIDPNNLRTKINLALGLGYK